MDKREETDNLRQYIVSQRILIQQLNERIEELVRSMAMLHASRKVEGPL